MKQTKTLRTLEELWDVEDRHPLLVLAVRLQRRTSHAPPDGSEVMLTCRRCNDELSQLRRRELSCYSASVGMI